MALIQMEFMSNSIQHYTSMNVLLPVDQWNCTETGPFPTLYLLHGWGGNYSDWVCNSRIAVWAQRRGIAVVMPSGDNSYYLNYPEREEYYEKFIGEELIALTRGAFPLSTKREDTWIAGLSMGGYGAFYLALSRPDLYSAAASFSGAVDIAFNATPMQMPQSSPHQVSATGELPFFVENCFGDITKMRGSNRDVIALYEMSEKENLPRLYQSCGTKDYLFGMNKLFYAKMTQLGAKIQWSETEGLAHEWDFWDQEVRFLLGTWLKEN